MDTFWNLVDLADKAGHDSLTYYMYCRVTGSRNAPWRERIKNPIFLVVVGLMLTLVGWNWRLCRDFAVDMFHLWILGD